MNKLDIKNQTTIFEKLIELSENPRLYGYLKMKGEENLYRIRVGDYRILYEIQDDKLIIYVVKIGHRKDIYDK